VNVEDFRRPVESLTDAELVEQYRILKRVQDRRRVATPGVAAAHCAARRLRPARKTGRAGARRDSADPPALPP
jgi:hypothetical protein